MLSLREESGELIDAKSLGQHLLLQLLQFRYALCGELSGPQRHQELLTLIEVSQSFFDGNEESTITEL